MSPTDAASPLHAAAAPPLVLASGSRARAAMLHQVALPFVQVQSRCDEASLRDVLRAEAARTEDAAVAIADMKATLGAERSPVEAIVLGSDQMLELDGDWLEKPADVAAARAQLLRLRGRTHRLVSAVVAMRHRARVWHAVDVAEVTVRPFSESWLDGYLEACGPEVTESVGSYRLEGLGAHLVSTVRGDHFTVLGMPLLPLLEFLRNQGVLRR
jgi:septum formation protein